MPIELNGSVQGLKRCGFIRWLNFNRTKAPLGKRKKKKPLVAAVLAHVDEEFTPPGS